MKKFWNNNWQYFAALILLILLILVYFGGFFKYDYLVPPGDDSLHHMTKAYGIMQTGQIADPEQQALIYDEVVYPPVFHIFMANLAQITGLNIVIVTQYFLRLLIILLIFNLYFIIKKLFNNNNKIALLSITSLILLCPQPRQIFYEGTYLDLAVANFYLPLSLIFLYLFFKHKKYFIPAVIFISATLLSHHLSAIYLILILAVINVLIFTSLLTSQKLNYKKILLIDVSLIFILALTWNYYVQNTVHKIYSLLSSIIGGQSQLEASASLNFIPTSLSQIPIFDTYIVFLGIFLIIFGVVGSLFLLFRKNKDKYQLYSKIIIFSWIGSLFIASRFSAVQLPERFARDMFLPLSILAGFGMFYILYLLFKNNYKYSKYFFIAVLLAIFINLTIPIFKTPAYNTLVRFQNPDDQAVEWINQNSEAEDVILGTPLMASSWGSFITLLTDRKVLAGDYCLLEHRAGDNKCDVIYNPNSPTSKEYYQEKNISYVYAGKPFVGPYLWKADTDYTYNETLEQATFLEAVFDERSNYGRVVIYKVNKNKL